MPLGSVAYKQRYELLRLSIHGDFLTLTTDFFISLRAASSLAFTAGSRTLVFFVNGCFITAAGGGGAPVSVMGNQLIRK